MMAASTIQPGVALTDLFDDCLPAELAGLRISDIAADSRKVVAGSLFLACRGRSGHGLDHLSQALENGAAAVAWEPEADAVAGGLALPVPAFAVPGLVQRLGQIADRFFGRPSAALAVIGITGTNGKTTCAHLVAGALEALGRPAGSIGTLGSGRFGALTPGTLTTPDAVEVHRNLARIRDCGGEFASMEVSSHALDQGRVAGVRFRLAALTNLSREHLDYHVDMQRYGEAKARLFKAPGLTRAVINADDEFGRRLLENPPHGVSMFAVGREVSAYGPQALCIRSVNSSANGLDVEFAFGDALECLHSPLWGEFNAENLAVALGLLLGLDVSLEAAVLALATVSAPAGRMEALSKADSPVVLVDYAHTPDALAKALTAARSHCPGKLFCVFGCGGERDPGKRPQMGSVAEKLADQIILTDDNPRAENGDRILADIVAGMTSEPMRQRDRAAAIKAAIAAAGRGDVVLVAGKGHENYQLGASGRRPFSDRQVVLDALESRHD
ncbi:MAG: UDP-N-acetylmuramoyl-L-alanyl-D-glutamate--2,6-diaminopimelate ligase [Gammaproteobacteria bacterium]